MMNQFISYPKSGRSWIRFILSSLGLEKSIVFQHDTFEFNNGDKPPHNFSISSRLAKYPENVKIVYLKRDPRDIILSLYFQVTGRFKDLLHYTGELSEFVRDPYFGAMVLQKFTTLWEQMQKHRDILTVSYEDMHSDPEEVIQKILGYYRIHKNPTAIRKAIEGASFNKMQRLEQSGAFPHPWLKTRNGFPKVRKGKLNGFREMFDQTDIDYLNAVFQLV